MNRHLVLAELFEQTAIAGYGFAYGLTFEAIPGLEGAAADYMEALLQAAAEDGDHSDRTG